MVGYDTLDHDGLDHEELSLLHAINVHAEELDRAEQSGVSALLRCLEKRRFPGGGGLCTERVLTYLEPAELFRGVLQTYLKGGNGTKKAALFTAALLGLGAKSYKLALVMAHLQARLESKDSSTAPTRVIGNR